MSPCRRSCVVLLAFAASSISSCGESLGATSECLHLAPYFLNADQRATLCRHAITGAPADCAKKAHGAPRLSGFHILELCSGETSHLPGLCVAGLSGSTVKYLSPALRVDLCRGARSDAPARCAEDAVGTKRSPQVVVDVCAGASSKAPAECLHLLPKNLPHQAAVDTCSGAHSVGPAVCTNVRGQLSHGSELTSRLCRGASGEGPADCFRRSVLVTALSEEDRVELCIGAETDAPARCAGHIRDRNISPSQKVKLCRGAIGIAPARCFASTPPSLPDEDRVSLCRGAAEVSPTASVACLKAVPQDLPSAFAVALCRRASDHKAAAECAKAARRAVGDNSEMLLTLCGDALSTAPAHCAKAAVQVRADKRSAVVLCAGSTSSAPASCFAAAPRQIPPEARVETCAGAQSTSPALCLAAAIPVGVQVQGGGGGVCQLDPKASNVPRRGIEYRLAARLCRNAPDDSPAQCARAAPPRMSDSDVEVLCAAEGFPQGEETGKCATAAQMVGFSSNSAALLCRGAQSSAPADCAGMAAHRIGEAGRVAVCTRASNNIPARCANSLSVGRAISESEIAECRVAVPHPSMLHILNLGHEGDMLFPDQPMHATLEVWDQWGGRIHSDSSTVVLASIAKRGSNGAVTNANGRFNTSSDGVVHFSQLSFSGPGNLTLQFFINGYNGNGVAHDAATPLAAARIVVAETEHGNILRQCRGIFRQLACPWILEGHDDQATAVNGEEDATRKEGLRLHREPSFIATEEVSTVSGGVAATWYVLSCQSVLEENGIFVGYVSSRRMGSLSALLWYHPGIEALETGTGLPTRDQPAWEQLGVSRNASTREVRRAYYRQSLLWHPDRWVRYAVHSARAQDAFQIVSDAYEWMVKSSSVAEGTSVQTHTNS